MATLHDAFISYGRADSKAFVIGLKEQLRSRGLSRVWLDLDDIPSGTDWQARIDDAIERSHHFIYVISPSAMASPYCRVELERAIACGKRILPLMHVRGSEAELAAWGAADPTGSAVVRQINWIMAREGVDPPEQVLDKLSRFLSFRTEQSEQVQTALQDYVQRHTRLLLQALRWQRRHRESRFLLVGSDRQNAEDWLTTRTVGGEPLPCTPSDLHCEFIVESIKNANNLMTQVFLCHSDQDSAVAELLRRSLLRQGITVWNYRTDIQSSQDYHQAIAQGIEEADNLIYVLSPASVRSVYCQQELAKAQALHKRVIPMLAVPLEGEPVPEGLRSLQHIDLTDNLRTSDYSTDESQLLKLLKHDADHHSKHKTWLVQALKWQRQQHNPAMLLRGYNLSQAETWRSVAQSHPYPPTELHTQFIGESLRQPPNPSLDVFISYSRVDSDFARRLNEALQAQGKFTWFDQESIATGTDFQREIYRGIESSKVFLFVLSPQSIGSPYCADEVEYAHGLNKPMVTVLHRAIDTADLHPVLAKLQWLDFRNNEGDFQANFQHLLRTLDTDRDHLESHTQLLGQALEWDRSDRDESLLMRGKKLTAAEDWLTASAEVEPRPTGLQQEYIRASRAKQEAREAADRRLQRGALLGALAAAAGLAVAITSARYALHQRTVTDASIAKANASTATADRQVAYADRLVRDANARVGNANRRVAIANRQIQRAVGEQQRATAAAAAAATAQQQAETRARAADTTAQAAAVAQQQAETRARAADTEAQRAADRARDADLKATRAQTATRLEQAGAAALARAEVDRVGALLRATKAGRELETALAEARIPIARVSDYPTTSPVFALQQLQATLPLGLLVHQQEITSASVSPTGDRVVTTSQDQTARVWPLTRGQVLTLAGHGGWVNGASFSPSGDRVVTASSDGTARVWHLATGQSTVLQGHRASVNSASFSPTGDRVVTASDDGTARLWDLATGTAQVLAGHKDSVSSARFSPTGDRIVTASGDGTARVWSVATGQFTVLAAQQGALSSASFSPTGDRVVTTAWDRSVRLWDLATGQSEPLLGHTDGVVSASFSPAGDRLLTTSLDGTALVWDLATGQSTPLGGYTGRVLSASFGRGAGYHLVTTAEDNLSNSTTRVVVWDLQAAGETASGLVYSASFNATGDQIVTASLDSTALVRNVITGQSLALRGHREPVTSASFSPAGDVVVTASNDRTARLWNLKTGQSTVLEGHGRAVSSARFSPSGDRVVTASWDGTARVWDLKTGTSTAFAEHQGAVFSARFSPDGKAIVTASQDRTARVWDLATGRATPLEGHTDQVTSASFSPDSRTVLTTSTDRTARLWDLATGQSTPLEGHTDAVLSASFSPTGQHIATAAADGNGRLWHLQTGQSILLEGHTSGITSIDFSPSGDYIITASLDDETVRVWDLQGRQLGRFDGSRVAISPLGQRLAVIQGGQLQLYELATLPALLAKSCEWLGNYLEYGQATDADRALCYLPPRSAQRPAIAPLGASLGQMLGQITWPQPGNGPVAATPGPETPWPETPWPETPGSE